MEALGPTFTGDVPDPDFEARREATKRRLAEYAEQLESEKQERLALEPADRRRRGDVHEKALELLVEGAVGVTSITPGRLEAEVAGDSGVHRVWWSDLDGWWCDCPASIFRRRCSHQEAVKRVVKLTTREEEPST